MLRLYLSLWYVGSRLCLEYAMNDSLPLQPIFAICNTPSSPLTRVAPCIFWIFIHLLEFELANQSINPAEDAQNKPYRPIPSGRCSLETVRTLRWILLAFCTVWSAYCSKEVFAASLFANAITYSYNNLGDAHWSRRNILFALLYFAMETGACLAKS